MEKEIKINIPEGYDDAVFDNETKTVKFIKKEKEYIKSWKDYCTKYHHVHENYSSYSHSLIGCECDNALEVMTAADRMQMEILARLRLIYFDWVQGWSIDDKHSYWVLSYDIISGIKIYPFYSTNRLFSFPTKELAEKFLETFKDMLEDVKELI